MEIQFQRKQQTFTQGQVLQYIKKMLFYSKYRFSQTVRKYDHDNKHTIVAPCYRTFSPLVHFKISFSETHKVG